MRVLLLLFILPLCALLQAQDTLTNQQVIQLVQSGVPADELLRMIRAAPAVSFHLTPADTDQLMRAGVSEQTIKAMSARERGLVFPTSPSPVADTPEPRTDAADRSNSGERKASNLPVVNAEGLPTRINIVVVEGEGVTSVVRQRAAHDPLVMVEDNDHRPITGAVVAFGLPISGTSGEFSNGAKSLTVVTDNHGQAAAHGLKANDVAGKLRIDVAASYHTLRARTLINQRVEGRSGGAELQTSKSGAKWKWVLVGVVAAGGAIAGVHFGTGATGNSPVSISPGAVAVGGPR